MNLDISANKLAEIRKILKERRRQKSLKKMETQPPQNNPVEKIANIVPYFSSTLPLNINESNKYPVSQELNSSLELKKRSVSEPPPNIKPVFQEATNILKQEIQNQLEEQEPEIQNQLEEEKQTQEPKQQEEIKIPPPPSKQRSSKRFFIF